MRRDKGTIRRSLQTPLVQVQEHELDEMPAYRHEDHSRPPPSRLPSYHDRDVLEVLTPPLSRPPSYHTYQPRESIDVSGAREKA